jgi:hypothetical protein
MTDDQVELRLRRALLDEGAEFAHSIDYGMIRTRLADATTRRQQSRRGLWLVAAAAVLAFAAVGVILVVAPKNANTPGQQSPGPSSTTSSGPVASPSTIQVDPGWRLALDHPGQFTTTAPDPIAVHFTLPADATRWALKVSCSGPSALVVWSTTFVHTASCTGPNGVSRAVYRVEADEASGEIELGIRGAAPTTFEVLVETTASELDDPLTIDPTPGPSDAQFPYVHVPLLVPPPTWSTDYLTLNGGSGSSGSNQSSDTVEDSPFRPGPVELAIVCLGAGTLNVELTTITDPAAGVPRIPDGSGQIVACTGSVGQVEVGLIRPATGTENALIVESETSDPDVPFEWSLAAGQDAP